MPLCLCDSAFCSTEETLLEEFLKSGAIVATESGKLLLGWGEQQHHSEMQQCDYQIYAPDFFLHFKTPWITFQNWCEMEFSELLDQVQGNDCIILQEWTDPDFDAFASTFADLKRRFKNRELNKGVPFTISRNSTMMDHSILRHLLKYVLLYAQKQPVYVYGTWHNGQGILGATPEILFRHCTRLNCLETMACAGTRTVKQGKPELLLTDQKELHEHRIVVEDIQNSLKPLGCVKVDDVRLLQLPNLVHLVTLIHAKLHTTTSFETIVKALHPTPALGASPRRSGWEWLLQLQAKDRYRFGAPFGCINRVSSVNYVAIRNIQWDSTGMKIAAGCGVVPESILESEWQEIKSKISAIKQIFKL